MKIAVVVCYDQTNYVRAVTLRNALAKVPDVEIINIRNTHTGMLRFIETPYRIFKARFTTKPDAYLVTFRGYEMLLYMVYTFVRKPIIFDELVNFTEWMEENKVLKQGTLPYKLFKWWYKSWVKQSRFILADTEAHAKFSSELNNLPLERYRTIPIATDETLFRKPETPAQKTTPFTVFYIGHMKPLHGLNYVLDAARLLKDEPNIQFRLIGGKDKAEAACAAAATDGAHVTHEKWLPFEEIPAAALASGLTVGGPFGNTLQSQYVITGKTYQFLALGMPVLIGANQVNGVFQDRVNCLSVPQGDAQAIADAIQWAYGHQEQLATIGDAGNKLYNEQLSQTVVDSDVQALIQDLRSVTR